MKIEYPYDFERERASEINKIFNSKTGEELTKFHSKSDVIFLADNFEKNIKVYNEKFDISPPCCLTLPCYTLFCGLKYTDIKLKTLQNEEIYSTLENNFRCGISWVLVDMYVKSDENKKTLFIDAYNLYGWAMSESLPYEEINFDINVKIKGL